MATLTCAYCGQATDRIDRCCPPCLTRTTIEERAAQGLPPTISDPLFYERIAPLFQTSATATSPPAVTPPAAGGDIGVADTLTTDLPVNAGKPAGHVGDRASSPAARTTATPPLSAVRSSAATSARRPKPPSHGARTAEPHTTHNAEGPSRR